MWLRILLLAGLLILNNIGTVSAVDSSKLRLNILPLECLTDVIDDGLNVYEYVQRPNCGNPPPKTTPMPDSTPIETVPSVTYINNAEPKATPQPAPTNNKLEVVYHAAFTGLHERQSILRTVIISVSTLSTISFIAFILRFL